MAEVLCYPYTPMKMKRLLIFIFALFVPVTVSAASYYIDARPQVQVRQNALSEREVPFNFFFDTGLADLPKDGTFDVSLKNNKTFNVYGDEFDLYQAVFRLQNIGDVLDISAGRQFLSPGFLTYLIDGLTTTIGKDDWPVRVTLLGGVPRSIETGDFSGNTGLVAGTTIELNKYENTHIKLSAVFDSLDLENRAWKTSETVLVGLSGERQFGGKLMPNLYGNIEFDTAAKVVTTGLLGLRLKAHRRIYLNFEGLEFNANRDWRTPSILALFAQGPFYQGYAGTQVVLVEDHKILGSVSVNTGGSYKRFKSGPTKKTNGYGADGSLQFSILPIKLETVFAYKFIDGYGGRSHDMFLALHDEPIKKLFLDAGANYTRYAKITNQKDEALSLYWMIGYEIIDNFVLQAGGEYLRNATFKNEWRGTAMLSYRLEGSM